MLPKKINTALTCLFLLTIMSLSTIVKAATPPPEGVHKITVDNTTDYVLWVSFEAKEKPYQKRIDIQPHTSNGFDDPTHGYATFEGAQYSIGIDSNNKKGLDTHGRDQTTRKIFFNTQQKELIIFYNAKGQWDSMINASFQYSNNEVKMTITHTPAN